jgi:hypothetical protein
VQELLELELGRLVEWLVRPEQAVLQEPVPLGRESVQLGRESVQLGRESVQLGLVAW